MTGKLNSDLSPEEQYEILSGGIVDLISREGFLNKLRQKKPLKIKAGFDPSKPDLHIGHCVLINKLCQFQELGHEVIFVVGDWTACVGDPSGQNKTRPSLSFKEAKANAETYIQQATRENFSVPETLSEDSKKVLSFFKRLDVEKTSWVYNSEWLNKLSLKDFILSISSKFTVARQLERNDFSLRYKSGKPIGLHEFSYPILQAYDSKELKADVEIGGTDQLFNLLLGRDLQEQFGQSPQVVLTLPLLEGLDEKISGDNRNQPGERKMSKSLNNAICFNDSPKDMYGKIMKISDKLLIRYWSVFTEGKRDLKALLSEKRQQAKAEKEKLAWLLVCAFHGEEQADKSQEEFSRVFSKKGGVPDQIHEYQDQEPGETGICQLIKKAGLCDSNSEARRGILSGAVRRDGRKLTDPQETLNLKPGDEFLLSFGKRKFKRVSLKWKKIHDLKAFHVYKKIKERGDKKKLCEELSQDADFKGYISLSSIKLKIENYEYLDTEEGLSNYSKQSQEVFEEYKDKDLKDIEQAIKNYSKNQEKS